MPVVSIQPVESQQDLDAVRELCLEWLEWHWREYPVDWPRDDNPMDPEQFKETLDNLEIIHARPKGSILLAQLDGFPAGCVMYNQAGPELAEFFRMYVSEAARGHGIGQMMLQEMFELMVADGYKKVRFSSATFLVHARRMYEAMGFVASPHPESFPE